MGDEGACGSNPSGFCQLRKAKRDEQFSLSSIRQWGTCFLNYSSSSRRNRSSISTDGEGKKPKEKETNLEVSGETLRGDAEWKRGPQSSSFTEISPQLETSTPNPRPI